MPETLQFRTINEAAQKVAPGDIVQLHSGIYRESVNIKTSGTLAKNRFASRPAPQANVVISGADMLDKWEKVADTGADNIFVTDWDHRFINWSKNMTHPDDDYHLLIGRGEQVSVNNYLLRQVLSRDKLRRAGRSSPTSRTKNCIFNRPTTPTTIAKAPPWAPHVEATTRENSWNCAADWVQLRGVKFTQLRQFGAKTAWPNSMANSTLSKIATFENSNGVGAGFLAPDITVRRCTFADNGTNGLERGRSASDADDRMPHHAQQYQKLRGRGWEAGGDKIVLCRDLVIEKIAFSGQSRHRHLVRYRQRKLYRAAIAVIADNEDAGIFYEISYGLKAHDNVIMNNGLIDNAFSWGANGGIALSSSPGCEIQRNLLLG